MSEHSGECRRTKFGTLVLCTCRPFGPWAEGNRNAEFPGSPSPEEQSIADWAWYHAQRRPDTR